MNELIERLKRLAFPLTLNRSLIHKTLKNPDGPPAAAAMTEAADALTTLSARLAEVERERDEALRADEAITAKLDTLLKSMKPGFDPPTCGCSYDDIGDVCLHHSPKLTAAQARIETLEMALRIADSWLERWAAHVGNCRSGIMCTCGLTRIRYDVSQALERGDE